VTKAGDIDDVLLGIVPERPAHRDLIRAAAGVRHDPALRHGRPAAYQQVLSGDEIPVADRMPGHDNVYVCATHSGVMFAPLLAEPLLRAGPHRRRAAPLTQRNLRTRNASCRASRPCARSSSMRFSQASPDAWSAQSRRMALAVLQPREPQQIIGEAATLDPSYHGQKVSLEGQ
jgi:hypothetical protein